MQLMDCHVHIAALNQRDLQLMTISNVKSVVAHIAEPDVATNIPWTATFDFVDRMLDFHTWRAAKYYIDVHVCACISMVGIPVEWEKTLARLPACVNRPEIVAIGEVGLEPRSITCSGLSIQEKVLRAQLDIARDVNKTVVFHTPLTEKPKWVDRYLGMIEEHKLDRAKVIIDHADPTDVKMITDAGCYAGITVQPWRKVSAADAAEMVKSGDRDLVLVDSDAGIPESDSLAVPKTAFEMRRLGLSEAEIQKVLWDNPRKAYGIK